MNDVAPETLRLDKWLWYARFCKTRSLATAMCRNGDVRVNRQPVRKSNQAVRAGDVLTFAQGPRIRVIRILALGTRRGPAPEAQTLYEDISPPMPPREQHTAAPGARATGAGRPTKRERRAIDRLRDR
ncbi:MAG: RNA-binding S4 domain-containing protein [Alphaproteobacteria bacterium]|nr:RNA-binding S4 domain-containing protein [Alphaproteobacteria bacterium]